MAAAPYEETNVIAKTLASFMREIGREVPEHLQRVIDRDAAALVNMCEDGYEDDH